MPGLSDFGDIHWTATAFAYTSLVCGLLSTFYAFYVQQTLNDLHNPEDVYNWLTSLRNKLSDRIRNSNIGRFIVFNVGHEANGDLDRIPSITAAAILTAPSRLLGLSIICLFVALGIYLGSLYTAKLGTLSGSNANLAVLLFFIFFSAWAIMEIQLPLLSKEIDETTASLVHNEEDGNFQLRDLGNNSHNVEPVPTAASKETQETGYMIREALEASILAQEESLKAQRAFLRLLQSQSRLIREVSNPG